jgi:hypothetical protein
MHSWAMFISTRALVPISLHMHHRGAGSLRMHARRGQRLEVRTKATIYNSGCDTKTFGTREVQTLCFVVCACVCHHKTVSPNLLCSFPT